MKETLGEILAGPVTVRLKQQEQPGGRQLMDHHHQLLRELRTTGTSHLQRLRPGQDLVRSSVAEPPVGQALAPVVRGE